jgi:hypothetical protein
VKPPTAWTRPPSWSDLLLVVALAVVIAGLIVLNACNERAFEIFMPRVE